MIGFRIFRDGIGGDVAARLGLDISGLNSWSEYTTVAVAFNGRDEGRLVHRARAYAAVCSTGERLVLLAALHAADFAWLADEMVRESGMWRNLWYVADEDTRAAVSAAILRQEGGS